MNLPYKITPMISEIGSCTQVRIDQFETSAAPHGRNTSLQMSTDTIHFPKAPKPPFLKRSIPFIGLILLQPIRFFSFLSKKIFRRHCPQKTLYQNLYSIAMKEDCEAIPKFLKMHAKKECLAGYLFQEFLSLPQLHVHFPEVLKGANVCLVNDQGRFFNQWHQHPHALRRASSHIYKPNTCYSLGHFLFWLDMDGNTRFQFEKTPLSGFFGWLEHMIDYLQYKKDNEQQGVIGVSPHTENYCLKISADV